MYNLFSTHAVFVRAHYAFFVRVCSFGFLLSGNALIWSMFLLLVRHCFAASLSVVTRVCLGEGVGASERLLLSCHCPMSSLLLTPVLYIAALFVSFISACRVLWRCHSCPRDRIRLSRQNNGCPTDCRTAVAQVAR